MALVTTPEDSEDDEDNISESEPQHVPSLTQAREALKALSLLQVFFEARNHRVGCKLVLDTGETLDELSTRETVQTTSDSILQNNFLSYSMLLYYYCYYCYIIVCHDLTHYEMFCAHTGVIGFRDSPLSVINA